MRHNIVVSVSGGEAEEEEEGDVVTNRRYGGKVNGKCEDEMGVCEAGVRSGEESGNTWGTGRCKS